MVMPLSAAMKTFSPQLGIFRQDRVLPLQQLLVQGECLLGVFRLASHGGAVAAHAAHLVKLNANLIYFLL